MRLPRIFDPVVSIASRYRSRIPVIVIQQRSSDNNFTQGTRAFASQGTSASVNTPDPLHPDQPVGVRQDGVNEMMPLAYFSTEPAVIPGPSRTTVQTVGWPSNPYTTIYGEPPAGRSEQGFYSGDLHMGPAPSRIPRYLPNRILGGNNGMVTGANAIGPAFPWNGDMQYVPHLWTARTALGTKGSQKLSDDNAVIPAIYAGNPR